jgi:hypothetical protein
VTATPTPTPTYKHCQFRLAWGLIVMRCITEEAAKNSGEEGAHVTNVFSYYLLMCSLTSY